MELQNFFKRYEQKYLLSKAQYKSMIQALSDKFVSDEHGNSTIMNIYYDTPDFRLIRRSLEKPVYKEKLRLRSYGVPKSESRVFLELKKKYNSVVYKRRKAMSLDSAKAFLADPNPHSQIMAEIAYFLSFYPQLRPRVLLSYSREALYCKDDRQLRITFDKDILWRVDNLDLTQGIFGEPLLKDGEVLMEIKTSQAIPLWLSGILTCNTAFKTSFSKYGNAYLSMLNKGELFALAN